MSNVPSGQDKGARRGPESDYRFDYVTFALLALGVALAIIEIARRYV
jgi:hypothetical protein